MKVSDILLEDAVRGPRSPWAGKLGYDDKGHITGGAIKWLEAIGATAEDVDEAFKKAKQLPSYKTLTVITTDVTGPKRKKMGTYAFQPDAKLKGPDAKIYLVLPNGQIRYDEKGRGEAPGASKGKLASPKPRVRPGDPVKSIVMMYDNAFQMLEKKVTKQLEDAKKK